ncbi:MAG: hypothetical protein J6I85_03315 [Clostridia bacterium]|nr:hypothetical protein [Clostridia bacterium]MBR0351415.1 hypothetical protein [Clostridia bacterium]
MEKEKLTKKIQNKKDKLLGLLLTGTATIGISNVSMAVEEISGGGDIQNSKIAQGFMKLIKDFSGYLMWIIPIAGVVGILICIFKIITGDEQDGERYKKRIVKILVCVIAAVSAVTIINLIMGYFGN